MHAFDYRRPTNVREAGAVLKDSPGAKLLAGLFPP